MFRAVSGRAQNGVSKLDIWHLIVLPVCRLAFVLLMILLVGAEHTFPWIGHTSHGENVHMPGWYTLPLLATREIIGMLTISVSVAGYSSSARK